MKEISFNDAFAMQLWFRRPLLSREEAQKKWKCPCALSGKSFTEGDVPLVLVIPASPISESQDCTIYAKKSVIEKKNWRYVFRPSWKHLIPTVTRRSFKQDPVNGLYLRRDKLSLI